MVMGIQGQTRRESCPSQANTDIDYPDDGRLLKGAWLRGKPRSARADSMRTSRESDDPVDDGLRTRYAL